MSVVPRLPSSYPTFFFFNDTATTEIYTLSLHDALPISLLRRRVAAARRLQPRPRGIHAGAQDRKSTRLNSSHRCISYAVFCLKKKKNSAGREGQRRLTTDTTRASVQQQGSNGDVPRARR